MEIHSADCGTTDSSTRSETDDDADACCIKQMNYTLNDSESDDNMQPGSSDEYAHTSQTSIGIPPPDSSDEDENLPIYQLRPQTRENKAGFTSTWIDQDQTGDYDPSKEARTERRLRNRFRLRSMQHVRPARLDGHGYRFQCEPLTKKVPTLLVTLNFSSEAGKSRFRQLAVNVPSETKRNHVHVNGYHLRQRKEIEAFTDDHYAAKKARHAPDLSDDSTGHPVARGCWECAGLGVECSLLTDESTWPCSTCADDHNDCDLIIAPARKRSCAGCKRRKVCCSYTYTLNHGASCRQCTEDGFECIAGPIKDTIRTRIRYDRDWSSNPLPTKRRLKAWQVSSCVECSEKGRPCSLSTSENSGEACEACRMCGESCTLEHLVPAPRSKATDVLLSEERDRGHTTSTSFLPTKRAKLAHHGEGTTTTIETKYCHPIRFNCDEKTNEPCHFCEEASYGILGMEMKEVEVIEWEDGRGLEEVSGGHKGDGVENTRMCTFCTMSRMSIIMCSEHEMRPIPNQHVDAMAENEAISELFTGATEKTRDWCAICPRLVLYECSTPCEDGSLGCPLKLCEECMLVLRGVYDGDLQKMLPELKDEVTDQKILGLRADYELLKQDGLLMRYVLWSNG